MLVRSVYKDAGLDPLKTPYVEAHGTGTIAGKLSVCQVESDETFTNISGDSAELRALANVFCNNGDRIGHLHVGSIKANIGHLESTSGIAGLIKTVLALERGLIPPNIHLHSIKKELRLEEWKIKVCFLFFHCHAGCRNEFFKQIKMIKAQNRYLEALKHGRMLKYAELPLILLDTVCWLISKTHSDRCANCHCAIRWDKCPCHFRSIIG